MKKTPCPHLSKQNRGRTTAAAQKPCRRAGAPPPCNPPRRECRRHHRRAAGRSCLTSGADALGAVRRLIPRGARQFRRSGAAAAAAAVAEAASQAVSLRSSAAGRHCSALTDSRHTRAGHENDRKLPHCAAEVMPPPREPQPAAGSGAQSTHSDALLPGPLSGHPRRADRGKTES